MRRLWSLCMLVVLAAMLAGLQAPVPGWAHAGAKAPPAFVDPQVVADLSASADQTASVIVVLRQQADLSSVRQTDRASRSEAVVRVLRDTARSSQRELIALLRERANRGDVRELRPLWIFNGIALTATEGVILELAARPDVLRIEPDRLIHETMAARASPGSAAEANLDIIGAPALWESGFRGLGVVVANMDSGVDVSHPDLAGRWRGDASSWFDPNGQHPTTPTDVSGHGTWTMGVMAGGGNGGTNIGLAPEARWIAVKIFDDNGTARASRIHEGFQWLLDPDGNPATPDAPHVVNNSWGFADPGCDLEFQADLQALRAAYIVPVFAAGNRGPAAGTSISPANYPEALAVGATNNTDTVYTYSSRGPSACGEPETIYPDVSAPGVDIRTTDLYGGYSPVTGTSMASPHVAGALALLMGAFPQASPDQVQAALLETGGDLGPLGPDNDYGHGRIDVLAAFQALSAQLGTPVVRGDVDCDRWVTPADASLIRDFVVALVPSLPCPEAADVSGDGLASMADALFVARMVYGLIDRFP